jgi:hypothetical protein
MTQPFDPQPQVEPGFYDPAQPLPSAYPPQYAPAGSQFEPYPSPYAQPPLPAGGHYPPPGGWGPVPDGIGSPPPPRQPAGHKGLLVALGTLVIVIVAIAAYFVFAGNSSSTNAPGAVSANRPAAPGPSLPNGFPTDLPSGFPTDQPSGLPTGLGALALCGPQTDPADVATTYVAVALTGVAAVSDVCVYRNSVPAATTQKLSGQLFLPQGDGTTSGSSVKFHFVSVTGTATADVTVTKESDGKYWVTSVSVN